MLTHRIPRPSVRRAGAALVGAALFGFASLPDVCRGQPAAQTKPRTESSTPRSALESIESTRGGRHWVDLATDPPKSPDDSLACFRIEPGYFIELVAAEPLVLDPVAVAFDERGRLFVAEYADYPTGPVREGDPPLSRVVLLEDTDSDGRADARHVFADQLRFAHSLMAYRGGILVGAQTEIVFLKDTDGDRRADVRDVLFRGFVAAHPQMQIGNPRWGLDNQVYWNYGPGEIVRVGGPDGAGAMTIQIPQKEFRFDPRTMEFGPASGLGQFGNTIDPFGHRFFCTNRNPIMAAPLSWEQWQRNPFFAGGRDHYDVGPSGGDTVVFPLVEMKSNYLSHAGTHTSACGTTAYLGGLFGDPSTTDLFVCEPIGHLVTRTIVRASGHPLTAERARPKADFLASSDTWFRPASLATGPDGSLYLADMYRLWVEHPKFLPAEIASRLDWRAGDDRGRVWRIHPTAPRATVRPFHPPASDAALVDMLRDANGWRRRLAQRLVVERGIQGLAPPLRAMLGERDAESGAREPAFARLHALWTLDGLGALSPDDLLAALADPDVFVRRDATKLAARFIAEPRIFARVVELARDDDARVRFEVALTLGATDTPAAGDTRAELALRDGGESWFATAILTSVATRSGTVLGTMIARSAVGATTEANGAPRVIEARHARIVRELSAIAGARGDVEELGALLAAIGGTNGPPGRWWRQTAIAGLAAGLPRHRGDLGPRSLAALIDQPPDALRDAVEPVRRLLHEAASIAADETQPLEDRIEAVDLLPFLPAEPSRAACARLLAPNQPGALQAEAVRALQRSGARDAARLVLGRWAGLGPAARPIAVDLLLSRPETILDALDAMADGTVSPSVLDVDQRVRLLTHADASIKKRAIDLLGQAVSANRTGVVRDFSAALTLAGASDAGMKVFDRVCAKCHRVDGRGHDVGPDISDVRNRDRAALLNDILDPNQKLEPRFTDYIVVSNDGRVLNGLIVSESPDAVVLRQSEGKEETIPRNAIDQLKASGKSLMPEGVETEINVRQMADLLEYLKGPRTPR